jgi:hypothetical protein
MNNNFRMWLTAMLPRMNGKMEIRPIDRAGIPVVSFFGSADREEIEAYVEKNQQHNVFFGVLARTGDTGGKESIQEAHCLWADIDFKELKDGKDEADGIISTFDLCPSLQIASGGGYHLYWFLDEPTTDIARVERILRGLVPRLKSDPKVAQAACILRPSGTLNYKYDPPIMVMAVAYEPENTYTLDDFKEWELPEEEQKEIDLAGIESEERLDVRRYLKAYKVPVVKVKQFGTSVLYGLKLCLFDENHTDKGIPNDASIGQTETGTLFYQCFHASCVGRHWDEVREKISGKESLAPFVLRDLKPLIENYVKTLTGETSIGSLMSWFDIKTLTERQEAMALLQDMAANRDIVWTGTKHGVFRPVDKTPHTMTFGIKRPPALALKLPLGLHEIVKLYPKNVILVAGEKDAGKTSFAMNTAYLNRDVIKVVYVNSEMGEEEAEARITNFPDQRLAEWQKVTWIEKSSKFEDVIDPNGLNIIDFLEIGSDAFVVADDIKRVFDRLNKGLLLIAMQKRSYKAFAVGGEATLEKSRLAVNLEHRPEGAVCKITVAKNWTGKILSPRGYECRYKISMGGKMEIDGEWYDPEGVKELDNQTGTKRLRVVKKAKMDAISRLEAETIVPE